MIHVISPGTGINAGVVVKAALKRSCGHSLVQPVSIAHMTSWLNKPGQATCWVLIDPPETWSNLIIKALRSNTKVMLFGNIPPSLADYLGATVAPLSDEFHEAAVCPPASTHHFSESPAQIRYLMDLPLASPIANRPLLRYDFSDEWNNLGYGAIRTDGSAWSVSQQAHIPALALMAEITVGERDLTAYCGLWDYQTSSLLWFNRSVGPIDSQEWRIVEEFLANHRHHELPCWPVLHEIPYGYDAAVTMRLDCDEDIESARPLWKLYQRLEIPFSLAVHTHILTDERQHTLLKDVLAGGGAILSHTATHAPNWGGSYNAALDEARFSADLIQQATGRRVRYAVSPFHQTPDYARSALADAGYTGCIGGIICNDPDFLMARAGTPPGSSDGFIGHSQQCMLHGDCLLQTADPLAVYKQAFELAKAGKAFFGYLDHPFSTRYQYGWADELQRSAMHKEFISFMKNNGKVLFCSQDDALDFLNYKAAIGIVPGGDNGFRIVTSSCYQAKWKLAVEYAATIQPVPEQGLLL